MPTWTAMCRPAGVYALRSEAQCVWSASRRLGEHLPLSVRVQHTISNLGTPAWTTWISPAEQYPGTLANYLPTTILIKVIKARHRLCLMCKVIWYAHSTCHPNHVQLLPAASGSPTCVLLTSLSLIFYLLKSGVLKGSSYKISLPLKAKRFDTYLH